VVEVRLATTDDINVLLRLRAVMLAELRGADERGLWEQPCRDVLLSAIQQGQMIAVVAEADGVAVAAGVAALWQWLPSPRAPGGRRAYIGSVATEPEHRGRGYGESVFQRLLRELWDRGVEDVELHATPRSEPLYRRAGFSTDTGGINMRALRPDRQ
jgi:ribosomal protein S18 acetylase RimI-like enzyme